MMKRVYYGLLAACLALALCAASALAATYYVDGTNGKDNPTEGTSWSDAYKDIQDAIDAAAKASGTTNNVFVKAGTYSLNESIQLKKGALVYGGFAGTETTLESRDIAKNETILDGSTIPAGTVSSSVVLCFGQDNNGNMLVDAKDKIAASDDTRIDGFTIQGGNGAKDFKHNLAKYGGGIYIRKTSPTIANCVFKDNKSGTGGAISINSGKACPVILNCRFENNKADGTAENENAVNGGGGAIGMTNSPSGFIIDNCTFISNEALFGGAIFMSGFSNSTNPDIPSTITNCTFTLNTAVASDTPISAIEKHNGAGGALVVVGSIKENNDHHREIDITNCTFINNKAKKATDGSEICLNSTGAKVNLVNTILYDDKDILSGDAASFDVTNCAYPLTVSSKVTKKTGNIENLTWTETKKVISVDNVPHTVFAPTSALRNAGTSTGAPAKDQLGITRASTPSIGAVEYLEVAVSTDTLPSGTVSSDYKQTLEAKVTPAQSSSIISWDITSGDLPAGITLSGAVISGTPTKAGSFDITVRVTVGVYEASKDLTLVINAAAAEEEEEEEGDEVKVAVADEATAEALDAIDSGTATKASITSADIFDAVKELVAALFTEVTDVQVKTAEVPNVTFTVLNAVDSDDPTKILATAIPAVNANIVIPVKNGTTISADVFPPAVKSLGDAIMKFFTSATSAATAMDTFASTVLSSSDVQAQNDRQDTVEMGTSMGGDYYSGFSATLKKPLPVGTILIFGLTNSAGATSYYAMILAGDVNTATSTIVFDVTKLRLWNNLQASTAPAIAQDEYEIVYSTLDGGDANTTGTNAKSVLAAKFQIAADPDSEGERGYLGTVALSSTAEEEEEETEVAQDTSSHGSSSGCNAGFGLFALAALALAYRKFSK